MHAGELVHFYTKWKRPWAIIIISGDDWNPVDTKTDKCLYKMLTCDKAPPYWEMVERKRNYEKQVAEKKNTRKAMNY